MEIIDDKAALRKRMAATRKGAHEAAEGAAGALADAVLGCGLVGRARVVSAYWPIRSEIDPRPLIQRLSDRGLRLCLPVIEAAARPLKFREWRPGATLVPGPFGAEVPEAGDWLVPDLLLVPLLAFDARGYRLGYGGGFYDRTLEGLRGRGTVTAIGLAYVAQQMDRVPTEPTDQPLDAVATEAGLILIERRAP